MIIDQKPGTKGEKWKIIEHDKFYWKFEALWKRVHFICMSSESYCLCIT